jgi:hypothetical protein
VAGVTAFSKTSPKRTDKRSGRGKKKRIEITIGTTCHTCHTCHTWSMPKHGIRAAGDFDAYEDALRAMMRAALETNTAKRGAA